MISVCQGTYPGFLKRFVRKNVRKSFFGQSVAFSTSVAMCQAHGGGGGGGFLYLVIFGQKTVRRQTPNVTGRCSTQPCIFLAIPTWKSQFFIFFLWSSNTITRKSIRFQCFFVILCGLNGNLNISEPWNDFQQYFWRKLTKFNKITDSYDFFMKTNAKHVFLMICCVLLSFS